MMGSSWMKEKQETMERSDMFERRERMTRTEMMENECGWESEEWIPAVKMERRLQMFQPYGLRTNQIMEYSSLALDMTSMTMEMIIIDHVNAMKRMQGYEIFAPVISMDLIDYSKERMDYHDEIFTIHVGKSGAQRPKFSYERAEHDEFEHGGAKPKLQFAPFRRKPQRWSLFTAISLHLTKYGSLYSRKTDITEFQRGVMYMEKEDQSRQGYNKSLVQYKQHPHFEILELLLNQVEFDRLANGIEKQREQIHSLIRRNKQCDMEILQLLNLLSFSIFL